MPLDMNELFAANFSISTIAADKARKLKRDLGFDHNYEILVWLWDFHLDRKDIPITWEQEVLAVSGGIFYLVKMTTRCGLEYC